MQAINNDFCINCGNLLVSQVSDNVLSFRCMMCNTIRPASDSDTLRYEEKKSGQMSLFNTILTTLTIDDMNPKKHIDCIKKECNGKFVRQARLGEDMRLVSGCLTCGHQWFDEVKE